MISTSMKCRVAASILLMFLLSAGPLAAQVRFDHVSIEDGLSQSYVSSVIQDSYGFIWIGTADGLNRYDGYSFTVYRREEGNQHSLPHNWINNLAVDREGVLWIGTRAGLARYNAVSDSFERIAIDFPGGQGQESLSITGLTVDSKGRLWVATDTNMLSLWLPDRNTFRHFDRLPNHETLPYTSIMEDVLEVNRTTLVLSNGSANLGFLNPETFERQDRYLEEIRTEMILDILLLDEFRLLIATSYGMYVYEWDQHEHPASGTLTAYEPFFKTGTVHPQELLLDQNDRLWVCTSNGILLQRTADSPMELYSEDSNNPYSPSLNNFSPPFEDRSGLIWFPTRGKGIDLYSDSRYKFQHIKSYPNSETGLKGNYVYALAEQPEGVLWVGTNEGYITVLDRQRQVIQYVELEHETGTDWGILCLTPFNTRYMLSGSRWGKLAILDQSGSLVSQFVQDAEISDILVIDETRALFALRSTGIASFDLSDLYYPRYQSALQPGPGLSGNRMICLARQGDIYWAGSEHGLYRSASPEGPWRAFFSGSQQGELKNDYINDLHVSDDGTLWVGTRGGLHRFNPQTESFEAFTTLDGLPNDVIYAIETDAAGTLWVSTNNGLCNFSPDFKRVIRNFSEQDGLQSREFNTGASLRMSDGTLVFGGINGINIFKPDEIIFNSQPPAVNLTRFTSFGEDLHFDKPLAEVRSVDLSHDTGYIGIEFAAMDYSRPDENRYRYQMSGIDGDWVEAGSRNYVTYNLNPGTYTFSVTASNGDGIWNPDPLEIIVTVHPAFWDTTLFRLMVLGCIISLLSGALYWRIRDLQRRSRNLQQVVEIKTRELRETNMELESFSYTLSHDLRSPLRTIRGFAEILKSDYGDTLDEAGKTFIERIDLNCRRMDSLVQDILWLSRAGRAELLPEPVNLSAMVKDILETLMLREDIDSALIFVEKGLVAEADEKLMRVCLENLITNAWKFSGRNRQREITFGQELRSDSAWYFIRDNGIGFDMNKSESIFEPFVRLHSQDEVEGTGIGLATVKKIIERHKGLIEAESAPGEGTTIRFTLFSERKTPRDE